MRFYASVVIPALILDVLRDSTVPFVALVDLRMCVAAKIRSLYGDEIDWPRSTLAKHIRESLSKLTSSFEVIQGKGSKARQYALHHRGHLFLSEERRRTDEAVIEEHGSLAALRLRVTDALRAYEAKLQSCRPAHLNAALDILLNALDILEANQEKDKL